MADRAKVTEDSLIEELEQARIAALASEQAGAAVSATMGKAKLAGLLIERKEVGEAGEFAAMNEQQLRDYIDGAKPAPEPTHQGTSSKQ